MTDDHLRTLIANLVDLRRTIQSEINRRFPIGSRAKVKHSGDVVRIWMTSEVAGQIGVRFTDHTKRFVSWEDLELINDAQPTP